MLDTRYWILDSQVTNKLRLNAFAFHAKALRKNTKAAKKKLLCGFAGNIWRKEK